MKESAIETIANKVGFWTSLALALTTLITFGFALTAVPISGANAPNSGLPYPYLDTLMQYPKDYKWPFPSHSIQPSWYFYRS